MSSDSDFIAELIEALPAEAHQALQSVLSRWAGSRVYIPVGRAAARRRAAQAMLSNGVPRPAVQSALQARFRVDADTARRDARRAIERMAKSSRADFVSNLLAASLQDRPRKPGS